MALALLSRQEAESSSCHQDCSNAPKELLANPDVGGIGVLVGFVATAWLVVVLVIFRYCLAFDPAGDPLANPRRDRKYGRTNEFKTNAIDVKTISIFSGVRRRLGHHSYWNMALTKVLLVLCDVQLLTGFGLLFSSFISLTCYISAYHWQIISYLAWFSSLTHAACLTALREYMYHHQMERNFRMVLMTILLAGLIAAIIPTGYFNWSRTIAYEQGTASVPASNARCFFNQKSIQVAWDHRRCKDENDFEADDGYPCISRFSNEYRPKSTPVATTAYESSTLSIVLLVLNFVSRSIKMFRTLSDFSSNTIRNKIGHWATSCIVTTAAWHRNFGITKFRRRLLTIFRPLDLMIALYLVAKLYLDVFSSEMADLFWLFLSSVWGTVRLFMARDSADVLGAENEWGFGQLLAVFLLLGPLTTVSLAIVATIRRRKKLKKQVEDGNSITQAMSLLASYRAEIIASQSTSIDVLDRVSSLLREIEPELRLKAADRRQSSSHADFEAIPLDELQQFPHNRAGPDANAPIPSPIPSEINLGIATLPNQNTLTGMEYVDVRGSLSFRFSQSQWMTIVLWFFYLQFLALIAVLFAFLTLSPTRPGDEGKPVGLLKFSVVSAFVVQPLNCFVAVSLGLYIGDGRVSKFQLLLISFLLFIVLLGGNVFSALPFRAQYFKWYYSLGPLIITVIQFIYLSFRQGTK